MLIISEPTNDTHLARLLLSAFTLALPSWCDGHLTRISALYVHQVKQVLRMAWCWCASAGPAVSRLLYQGAVLAQAGQKSLLAASPLHLHFLENAVADDVGPLQASSYMGSAPAEDTEPAIHRTPERHLPHSPIPALGPLGNYLLARWKSQVAAQQVYHPAFREGSEF